MLRLMCCIFLLYCAGLNFHAVFAHLRMFSFFVCYLKIISCWLSFFVLIFCFWHCTWSVCAFVWIVSNVWIVCTVCVRVSTIPFCLTTCNTRTFTHSLTHTHSLHTHTLTFHTRTETTLRTPTHYSRTRIHTNFTHPIPHTQFTHTPTLYSQARTLHTPTHFTHTHTLYTHPHTLYTYPHTLARYISTQHAHTPDSNLQNSWF